MPIYEYQCDACGHQLEHLQKISDDPLTACPECGQLQLRKLISRVGFRLKGTGWYETDFKNKPKAKSSEKATESSGKSADKPDAKGDGTSKSPNKPEQKSTSETAPSKPSNTS